MNITYAKYIDENGDLTTAETASYLNIKIDDGALTCVPIDIANSHYNECKAQIDAGTLVPQSGKPELTWEEIRSTRDQILRDTDWTMTTGATVDQAQWAAYRQVIRDIPQTYKDKTPDDVVWPTQPSTAGPNS